MLRTRSAARRLDRPSSAWSGWPDPAIRARPVRSKIDWSQLDETRRRVSQALTSRSWGSHPHPPGPATAHPQIRRHRRSGGADLDSVICMAELPDFVFRATLRRSTLVNRFGITDHELRGPMWRRPLHGHYCFGFEDATDPTRRIRDAMAVMPPDGALSGWAAAYVLGVTDLDGRRWSGGLEPVLIALPYHRRIRREGIDTVRAPLPPTDVTEVKLVRVTTPARTGFELLRRGPLEDAVVAVDAMLRRKVVTLDEMHEYVNARSGSKGVPQARAALRLADGRAASCPESRMRFVWVVEAGLPTPEVNRPVHDLSGRMIGIPDLVDEESGLVGEYDGGQHRELLHHTADNAREERLEAAGLTVVRATSLDLKPGRQALVARFRDGRERALRYRGRRRWFL